MLKKPKRRVVKNLMSKSVNVFNGRKSLDKVTHLESPLEADFCYHLEFDQNIKSYQAQPLSFLYYFEGAPHSYTPDFEVLYQDGSISYFEIKFEADIKRINNFSQWEEAVRNTALKNGKDFIVLTESFIREKPLYENLLNTWAATNIKIDKDFLIHLIQQLDDRKQAPIRDLILDKSSDYQFEQIYRLIFEKRLITSLQNELLSTSSMVQHSGKPYDIYL